MERREGGWWWFRCVKEMPSEIVSPSGGGGEGPLWQSVGACAHASVLCGVCVLMRLVVFWFSSLRSTVAPPCLPPNPLFLFHPLPPVFPPRQLARALFRKRGHKFSPESTSASATLFKALNLLTTACCLRGGCSHSGICGTQPAEARALAWSTAAASVPGEEKQPCLSFFFF